MAATGWKITPPFFNSADDFTDYAENVAGATPYAMAILSGLQGKPVYQGTVDPVVVAARRRRNKAARRSRRINRLAVKR